MAVAKGWKGIIDGVGVEVTEQTVKDTFVKEAPDAKQVTVLTKDGKTQVKRVEDLAQVPAHDIEALYSSVSVLEKGTIDG